MKKYLSILLIIAVAFSVISCPKEKEEADASELSVVLLVNGELGDKSFFDSASNGLKLIKDEYGDKVVIKTIEMGRDTTKWVPSLLDVSEADWDIIICGTWMMVEPLQEVAPDYPNKNYILFDASVDYSLGSLDHVYSVNYKQNEASFLAGALAAKITNSDLELANPDNVIGFLGGMDIPVINDFLVGYIQGAQYVDPDIKIDISYIGSFSDAAKGKEMALAQYNAGADIGYNVAGQAGLGQIDAAKDVNRYAIGVDSDQAALFADTDSAKADLIATSVLKRVDNSLFRAIQLHLAGTLPYGSAEVLGFTEGGVGIADNEFYRAIVPQAEQDFIVEIADKIVAGEIVVQTAFGLETDTLNQIRNEVKP